MSHWKDGFWVILFFDFEHANFCAWGAKMRLAAELIGRLGASYRAFGRKEICREKGV